MRENLFLLGTFTLHSGKTESYKIECDALSDSEIDAIAHIFSGILQPFGKIVGVPGGGLKLAQSLEEYKTEGPLLIVDDVLTTGLSMTEMMINCNEPRVFGAVIFARGKCPGWVVPLFQMPVR